MSTEISTTPNVLTQSAGISSDTPVNTVEKSSTAIDSKPSENHVPSESVTTGNTEKGPNDASLSPVAAATASATPTSLPPIQALWATAKANGHPEIWGVILADPESHIPTRIVLQKYLNANDGDLTKATEQLTKTLQWRAKTKPLELLEKQYSKDKFDGLGYVTTYSDQGIKEVFTWNIYGNTKKIEDTFGNLEEYCFLFIEWRVALMELALKDLSIATATVPITAEDDPYKIFQVHDYKSISFFRSPPSVKSASSETIKVFAQNYPELLKEKFFVNVPAIMGFMYTFMKLFVAAKTIKKFHPMSNGGNLALEFKQSKLQGLGERLPKEYGGQGGDLKTDGKEIALY